MKFISILMAAGKGKRMQSELPKVLIPFQGEPILERILRTLQGVGGEGVVVIPEEYSGFEPLFKVFGGARFCSQLSQRGTADAIASAHVFFPEQTKPAYSSSKLVKGQPFTGLDGSTPVMLMAGDLPCITQEVLRKFLEDFEQHKADVAVLGFEPPDPYGFGRLVCSASGKLLRIVEERDATDAERRLRLCNSGIILAKFKNLWDLLAQVRTENAQNEYYLTDIIGIAVDAGLEVVASSGQPWQALTGVNTKEQLQKLEQWSKTEQ